MFYCDACGKERGWPHDDLLIPVSRGRCEVCGQVRACNDVPTSHLPPAPEEPMSRTTPPPYRGPTPEHVERVAEEQPTKRETPADRKLAAFRKQVAAERKIAMALAERFTQEELGEIYDVLGPLDRIESMRSLAHAVGTAWADYEYGGDQDVLGAAAVARGEIA
jgi:hypothetical protein